MNGISHNFFPYTIKYLKDKYFQTLHQNSLKNSRIYLQTKRLSHRNPNIILTGEYMQSISTCSFFKHYFEAFWIENYKEGFTLKIIQSETTKTNNPQRHSITRDENKLFLREDLYNQNYPFNFIQQFLAMSLCSYFHSIFHIQTDYYEKHGRNSVLRLAEVWQLRNFNAHSMQTVSSQRINKIMFKCFARAAGFLAYQEVLNNIFCTTLKHWSVRNMS